MKKLGKAIRSAHAENRPWTQELARFLLNYRATPHSTTGAPPADLLFNRKIRGKLPILDTNRHVIDRHREARENDKQRKASGKKYADQKRHAKENCLRIGDQVIVKQQKTNKLSTNFSTELYTVKEINGTKIVAESERSGHRICRNISYFEKVLLEAVNEESEEDTDIKTQQRNEAPRRSTRPSRNPERFGTSIDF